MKGIKVTYGNQTKRISEEVKDYESLIGIVNKLFSLTNDSTIAIKLCYVDGDEKIEVASNQDYQGVKNYHSSNKGTAVMKIEVYQECLKESLNVDEMLNNMNLSESFAMIDKRDAMSIYKPVDLENIQKIDENEEWKNSSMAKSVAVSSEDKATQDNIGIPAESKSTETNKIEFYETGANTNLIEKKEEFTQMENKSLKDNSSDTEKVNTKEEYVQAKENPEITEKNQKTTEESKLYQDSYIITDELIVSKLDDILSLKMNEVENNLKKIAENQLKEEKIENIQIDSNNIACQIKDNELIKEISNPNLAYQSLYLQGSGTNYHFNEYCSLCKFQILKNKYICILCNDYTLCSQCESKHLFHPLLKVNVDCKTLTSKQELVSHFQNLKEKTKGKGLLQNIFKMVKPCNSYYASLRPSIRPTVFAMAAGEKLEYELIISNEGRCEIEEEINLVPINNKNLNVSPRILEKLGKESKKVNIVIEAPCEKGYYEFEIHALMKKQNLTCEPLKFELTVTQEQEVEETNAKILLGSYNEVMKLEKQQMLGIYRILSENVFERNLDDSIRILKKHNYDISSAWEELERKDNHRGECYYGMEY